MNTLWRSILYWGILIGVGCAGIGLIGLAWTPPLAIKIFPPAEILAFWRLMGWTTTDIVTWRWPFLFADSAFLCFWLSLPHWYGKRLHIGPFRAVYRWCQRFPILILIGLLGVGQVVIFADFLFGKTRLCYIDVGYDSVSQVMPFTYYFTNVYHFNQLWLHESVLGNNIFTSPMTYNIFDPLLHLIFSQATIAEIADRMVYYVMLQSLIAGIGCYGFLRRSPRTPVTAIIGALSYSFCGAFAGVATWGAVWVVPLLSATAVVLWAFKIWQQERRWVVLVGTIMYFIVSTQMIVTLYQLAVFLLLYIGFDWLVSVSAITRVSLWHLMRRYVQTAVIGGLSLLCLGIVTIPHLYYMVFQNYRYHSAFIPLFQRPPFKEILAGFFRLFSNDLAGTANRWTINYGYLNYMELPFLYSGLLLLIAIPAFYVVRGFHRQARQELAAVSLLLTPIGLSLLMPGVRALLFYGGKLTYFRWMCAFVTITIVILGTYALDGLFASVGISRTKTGIALASGIWLTGLGVCYLSVTLAGWRILDNLVLRLICGALIGYPLLFCLPNSQMRHACLIVATLIELIWQGHYTVTEDRVALQKADLYSLYHTNVYSYPPMLKLLDALKNNEGQPFFRISKTAEYSGMDAENSALCQLYYGTRGYTSFNNKFTIAFFLNRRIPLRSPESAWGLPGFQNRHVLDNLVGVKYYLTRGGDLPIPSWGQPVMRLADVNVFVNPQAFPPGVIYHEYLWQTELDALPLAEDVKDNVFMLTAVVPATNAVKTALDTHGIPHLDNIQAKITNASGVLQAIHDQQANGVELLTFDNDVITGQFSTPRAGILFFSIPFDVGWHIYLDDQEIEKFPVHIGFLGAFVPAGQHTVKLVYLPRVYQIGKIVSACALGTVGLGLTLFRKSSQQWLCFSPDPSTEQQ